MKINLKQQPIHVMRVPLCLLLLFLILPLSAQITYKNNAIRTGDEIIKQQVEYKDPGRSGENVVWNFGQLNAVNPEYKLRYESPQLNRDSLYIMGRDTIHAKHIEYGDPIIAIEHRTMYYYRLKGDSLFLLGYENPINIIRHSTPILSMIYPLDYKQQIKKDFKSQGVYSSNEFINTKGYVSLEADARGILILPSNDTVSHTLRIKTIQSISNIDTLNNFSGMEIETYRWYAKGYRYPIFEIIKSFLVSDTTKQEGFKSAFLYPPQNHFYASIYFNVPIIVANKIHKYSAF
ncbi:hypothetical protein D0T53_08860 [Dysgonomonas sp. 216]|uniref:hypothetical protein n=1 Tax=Dysgonomonas sp. 216 TaxID=2302934 RepID=UPI001C8732DF|nr:hypothetical protein [Dysgonomonas sp. 216]NDW19020.1 hypothetical protein [Dysgonomonas sp. 216]